MNLMTHKVDHKTNTIFFSVVADLCIIAKKLESVSPSHAHRPRRWTIDTSLFADLPCDRRCSFKKKCNKIKNSQHDIDIIVARGAAEP